MIKTVIDYDSWAQEYRTTADNLFQLAQTMEEKNLSRKARYYRRRYTEIMKIYSCLNERAERIKRNSI